VPQLPCKQLFDLGVLAGSKPWNGIGWTPVTLYPFAIGLGFLMPQEMSFSCWFGLLLWKLQKVILTAYGISPPWVGSIYSQEQVSGVWLAVIAAAMWAGRHAWRRGWHDPAQRGALALALAGAWAMITFGHRAGMSWGFSAFYWITWLGFSTALARMRAEFGPPCHDLYGAGPDRIVLTWLGSAALAPRDLTSMAVFYWLAREAPRSLPQPHQLEGLYLAGGRLPTRRIVPDMLVAGLLSAATTFWVVLHYGYALGSESRFGGPAPWFATEGFQRLDNLLLQPTRPDFGGKCAMTGAFFASLAALWLRSRVLWFGFHPAGYAISSWWAINLLWCPLLVSWLIKGFVIRYGGGRAYRAWRPFFFGLVLGDFVIGSLWQVAGLLGGFTAYAFWI
jgi:hypothetical protein